MKKSEKIIAAIVTMVIGVLLIAMRGNFIGVLMTLAGICLIAFGALDIFHREVPPAVIKIVAGVLIIICGWALVEAVLYIVAAILLIAGILLLYDKIKKRVNCDTWLLTVLEYAVPGVLVFLGVLLLFHQAVTLNFIFIVSGIFTVIEGVILLTNSFLED